MGGGSNELKGPDLAKGVALADLTPGVPLLGHANGESVILVRVGDEVHAIGAFCTHYGAPLAEGLVVATTVRCPWHHACFDLKTGEAVGAPALADVACYETERKGDLVQVRTKREPERRAAPPSAPSSVVIVGAGAAGAACVETLRKEGYAGPITMIGAEEPGPVDRPNLSKDYLAGNAPEEWIPLGTRERYAELRVELVANDPVQSIDTSAKKVKTQSGAIFPYDALLYAPGAEPARLPIPGADDPRVHTLRALGDSRAIIARATSGARRAVVVGASFIGLEAAASLRARGLEVHVVGREPLPLARVLGDELGRFVQKVHEDKGVRFHLNATPKSISPTAVELVDGTSLPCDLVVLGVGVKPRVSLAERAGLKVVDGVVVDELLRTSAPSVWAAGDVARHPDAWLGEPVRIEHWVVAERQGQAAARAMLGRGAPYREVPFFWSAHYDVTIAYVGHAERWDRVEVLGSLDARDAAVVYRRGGKVLAVATVNRDATSLRVEAAMQERDAVALEAALAG
jgi:NADPH-dependent 2,4-dienoyl-CoA reductase/sulfur reductase-like enzyme/nitrite reductase/ring-hydroxylating ferredoxin subunit